MKKLTAILAVVLATVMLSGCGKNELSVPSEIVIEGAPTNEAENSVFPVKLPDGTEIKSAPERCASLSPAVTEIIAELGYSDRLCAVSRYCDFPEGLTLPQAGSSENPDIDKLTGLAPEVLFTLSPLAEREVYALEQAGITVVNLAAPCSVEDYGALYGRIAAVFGGEEAGKAAAEKAVSGLKSAASALESCTFVYVTPKLTAAGADTFESAVLSLFGENLCSGTGYVAPGGASGEDAESSGSFTDVPQYIFAADSLTEADISSVGTYKEIISGGAQVVFLPAERFERPSARLAEVFSAISGEPAEHQTAEE